MKNELISLNLTTVSNTKYYKKSIIVILGNVRMQKNTIEELGIISSEKDIKIPRFVEQFGIRYSRINHIFPKEFKNS